MSENCHYWVEHKHAECGNPAEQSVSIAGVDSLLLCRKHHDFLSEKLDLDTFDRPVVKTVVSLGASCYPFMRMKNMFAKERYLFDACRCSHQTLLIMLKTKFRNILKPALHVPNENNVRIGFYDDYNDFWVGHRQRQLMPEIDDSIRRRAQRFLDLPFKKEYVLFIRLRNYYSDPSTFLEPVFIDQIIDMIEKEQDEIYKSLKQFGFENFDVFYIVSSPILTMDGFVTIPEGPLSESVYCLEYPETFINHNWKKCFDHINANYGLPNQG